MKKSFGQHFLFDPNILRKIVECGDISSSDTVLEIGPGLGSLTGFLSERAGKVIAIEFDRKLIDRLQERLSDRSNVQIITADALQFPYDTIAGRFKVVANIPYYITTPLLFRLLEIREKIESMTLLMQKEVALRIVASPGGRDYGVLSIAVQFRTIPEIRFFVSRKVFSPPPSVDSAVVHFSIPCAPLYEVNDEPFFFEVVRTAFSKRRKTVLNSLGSYRGISESLQKAGIDCSIRPERLGIEDFARLANLLLPHNVTKRP
jgi:16S rRNA (adenine1518-N6/adenine1519-N6)-dimethyltransferase